MAIFATYKRQQTMLELPEIQSKDTTNCDNSSVTDYKTWVFATTTTLLLLFGSYVVRWIRLDKERTK